MDRGPRLQDDTAGYTLNVLHGILRLRTLRTHQGRGYSGLELCVRYLCGAGYQTWVSCTGGGFPLTELPTPPWVLDNEKSREKKQNCVVSILCKIGKKTQAWGGTGTQAEAGAL